MFVSLQCDSESEVESSKVSFTFIFILSGTMLPFEEAPGSPLVIPQRLTLHLCFN